MSRLKGPVDIPPWRAATIGWRREPPKCLLQRSALEFRFGGSSRRSDAAFPHTSQIYATVFVPALDP